MKLTRSVSDLAGAGTATRTKSRSHRRSEAQAASAASSEADFYSQLRSRTLRHSSRHLVANTHPTPLCGGSYCSKCVSLQLVFANLLYSVSTLRSTRTRRAQERPTLAWVLPEVERAHVLLLLSTQQHVRPYKRHRHRELHDARQQQHTAQISVPPQYIKSIIPTPQV